MKNQNELIKRLEALTGLSHQKCYEYLCKNNFDLNATFLKIYSITKVVNSELKVAQKSNQILTRIQSVKLLSNLTGLSSRKCQEYLKNNDYNLYDTYLDIEGSQDKEFNSKILKKKLSTIEKIDIVKRLHKATELSYLKCREYLTKHDFDLTATFAELDKNQVLEGELILIKEEEIIETRIKNDLSEVIQASSMEEKSVGIFATMSAGKSTLINALIGNNLCPSQNEACTATILKFTNNDEIMEPVYLDEIGKHVATLDSIRQLNQTSDSKMIEIEVNFKGIYNQNQTIQLFDTPGVNYSQDLSHGELSFQFLSNLDFNQIIYVMNATQLGVEDDRSLLIELKKKLKNQKTDLIFLINKIDVFDLESDESIHHTVEACLNYLQDIGFEKTTIIPISAHAAKVIRMGIEGAEMSRKELRDFSILIELFNDPDYYLPKYVRNLELEDKVINRSYGSITVGEIKYPLSNVMQALEATGILTLEQLLN